MKPRDQQEIIKQLKDLISALEKEKSQSIRELLISEIAFKSNNLRRLILNIPF
jgi:YesN/AraC family two-component response regulator